MPSKVELRANQPHFLHYGFLTTNQKAVINDLNIILLQINIKFNSEFMPVEENE